MSDQTSNTSNSGNGALAFILGGGNLLKMHLKKVSDQRPGWAYSAITVIAFVATLVIGLFKIGVPYRITVIKKDRELFMHIRGDGREKLCHFLGNALPPIVEGRIGLRHMYTRGARYRDFRVSVPGAAARSPRWRGWRWRSAQRPPRWPASPFRRRRRRWFRRWRRRHPVRRSRAAGSARAG